VNIERNKAVEILRIRTNRFREVQAEPGRSRITAIADRKKEAA
jgi:hypothetical protein